MIVLTIISINKASVKVRDKKFTILEIKETRRSVAKKGDSSHYTMRPSIATHITCKYTYSSLPHVWYKTVAHKCNGAWHPAPSVFVPTPN
ncbi:hypothetical protein PPL_03664 [Heterostelium album PN500]|uniref:Uncharacterized protein n=1 Tax=Heterostelium pallidum (strain ATCC 26659 / Pp 5 / PN500) TaxID=670386 RepID=D3B6B6_HETP5|nr:hypothetical protein PPL_03664 [Heterostelium album PN500]EFA82886.1 hypothetical protein PPL_03664 [Heterostelium album PN500]|eukprot:XP_020435003.1 hypothetical protein PPL_03664 [Heterostelium album PN500]